MREAPPKPKKLLALALLLVVGSFAGKNLLTGQTALQPRWVRPKPIRTVLDRSRPADTVVLKFAEGSRVRGSFGSYFVDRPKQTGDDLDRLSRSGLDADAAAAQVDAVNALLNADPTLTGSRLFSRPEAELDAEKASGEAAVAEELADLNLYTEIHVGSPTHEKVEALIDALNGYAIVELAYLEPRPEPAAVDIPPTTPDYTAFQGYLNGASQNGVDARYAWTKPGGKGDNVRAIDVEVAWQTNHEDLEPPFFISGNSGDTNHGTAVFGVIAAAETGYGVTGIAPRTALGGVSVSSTSTANAINVASANVSAGDLIVIELHAPGPVSGQICICNCDQFQFVAMEYWQANFDAIKAASNAGRIVVEAAGNGSMSLDSSIYGGAFNPAVRHSGAILVAAGSSAGRAPMCWTNYGSRVDLQGWGENVATLGYGDLFPVSGDIRQWYTRYFSGTSSATPIVTGSVASIQGVLRARGQLYSHSQMRTLLVSTGTPQALSGQHIGPLPNLRAAIDALQPPATPTATHPPGTATPTPTPTSPPGTPTPTRTPTPTPTPTPPPPVQTPVLTFPKGCVVNTSPLFQWNAVPGATSYYMAAATVHDDTYFINDFNVTTNSYPSPWPLWRNTRMKWKVKACGSAECGPTWSQTEYFACLCVPKADFNKDRTSDVLLRRQDTGDLSVMLMNGSQQAGFAALSPSKPAAGNWDAVGTADFNADSYPDVLWRNRDSGNLAIWHMSWVPATSTVTRISSGTVPGIADLNWKVAATGDFDGDAKADIVWHNAATGEARVWLMNNTAFVRSLPLNPGVIDLAYEIAAVGDLNGDSRPDFLLKNRNTGAVVFWILQTTATDVLRVGSGALTPSATASNWRVVALEDLDLDASLDVVWQNETSNKLVVWYMDGSGIVRTTGTFFVPDAPPDPNLRAIGPR